MNRPVLAVTMGDPAGIGPEICLKALNDPRVLGACTPVVIGNAQVLRTLAGRLRIPLNAQEFHPDDLDKTFVPTGPTIVDMHVIVLDDFTPGRVESVCGHAAYEYIAYAIDRIQAGVFEGMVTGPINKEALNAAGVRFPGHTEILETQTGSRDVVMMLYSPQVVVSMVSAHIPLRSAAQAVTRRRVGTVIRLTHKSLFRLLGHSPRLAALGLNPRAGEHGLFGDEESRAIVPAVEAAQADGILVEGPLSPDTAFTPQSLDLYDGHVCMYHDQGLIPFKTLSFDEGVNVTLGTPIIRTSVGHGTAFDIAWQGKAKPDSLIAAILLAAKLAGGQT